MDDPNNKPDSDGDATATSAAGESQEQKERLFSQAEVDAIVARRVSKAEKATEKRLKQDSEPAQKKDVSPTPGNEELLAKLAALEAKSAFAEALADLDWKPSKDDAELLRDAFKAGGADAMAKFANRIKPQQAAAEEKKMDDAAKYKSPGAPSGAPPDVLERDATKWGRDYIERLKGEVGKNGKSGFMNALEAYRQSLPGGGDGVFRKRIPK